MIFMKSGRAGFHIMEQATDQRDIVLRRSRQAYSLGITRDNVNQLLYN